MSSSEEPDFVVSKVNGIEQHFYLGGIVTFDPKPNVNSEQFLISAIHVPDMIEVTGAGQVVKVKVTDNANIWVMEIPGEVRAESSDKSRVAPFRITDEYDYNDDVLYWKYDDAYIDARLWAEDNEADCEIVNAYNNDVEYIEYEEPEEEEEDEEEDDEE